MEKTFFDDSGRGRRGVEKAFGGEGKGKSPLKQ